MKQQILTHGTVLSDRFSIETPVGKPDLGQLYKAVDIKTQKPVSLRVIPLDVIKSETQLDGLRQSVRDNSTLTHRNIQSTFGMGVHDDSLLFIASEWIEGENLRSLLEKRMKAGKRFSFKGAYNIIGHVCNALSYAHEHGFHGTLSPCVILVNTSGRVKVCDFALSLLRREIKGYPGRDTDESIFWAPEISGNSTTPAGPEADIYSVGALFYELLTGRLPAVPLAAPSSLGFSADVDQVIARCMGRDPAQRFSAAESLKSAVAELVQSHDTEDDEFEIAVDDDLGINVEIDLQAMAASKSKSHQEAKPLSTPVSGSSMLDAPGLPPPPNRSNLSTPNQGNVSTIDMGELLSGLSSSEAAKWMVQKDKFDHGPFTDRELVQMILLGEVEGKHQLLDMDTGVRKKLRTWDEFLPYIERYRIKKKQQEEEAARVRAEKAEVRGAMAGWLIVLIVVGVIGLAVGAYLLSRTLRAEKTYTPEEMAAALDSGEIKLKTGGNLIAKGDTRGSKGGRRGGGGGSGGGGGKGMFVDGMTYEEAMNMGVDLGSAKSGGGQQQLTPQDITNIMDRNVRRFLPCMAGQTIKRVDMNIAIAGDGRVMGISVSQGNDKLQKCVQSVVRSIKFPQSTAPRTAASWYFEIY